MTEEDIIQYVAKAVGCSVEEVRDKYRKERRDGRQVKANALYEGASSPSSPRAPVGVFFVTERNADLAVEGAVRRLSGAFPFPEACVTLFDAGGSQEAMVFGYPESKIAATIAHGFGVELENVERPREASVSKNSATLDVSLLLQALQESPNVLLQGPPGTGKSSLAMELIRSIAAETGNFSAEECRFTTLLSLCRGDMDAEVADVTSVVHQVPVIWEMVQLHATYSYDDLVRRVVPTSEGGKLKFEVQDRILPQLCKLAQQLGPEKKIILILDEINRCNLASVLGEFIFAIDPPHRGVPVRLQYQGGGMPATVSAPPNLWIVGTMNTADRSIALVDYAVRRRFNFIDIPVSPSVLGEWYGTHHAFAAAAQELLSSCNEGLDERIHVAHSMFLLDPLPEETWPERMARKVAYHVAPLLAEYIRDGLRPPSELKLLQCEMPLASPRQIQFALATALRSRLSELSWEP